MIPSAVSSTLCRALATMSLVSYTKNASISFTDQLASVEQSTLITSQAIPRFQEFNWKRWMLLGVAGTLVGLGLWSLQRGLSSLRRSERTSRLNSFIIPEEEPLLDRLQRAHDSGREVEIFHRDKKEKYVGVITGIDRDKWIQLHQITEPLVFNVNDERIEIPQPSHGVAVIGIDGILTIRGRKADDLTSKFVHKKLEWPQLKDKSINKNGTYSILIDYDDPRLQAFFDQLISPLRGQLYIKRISEVEATEEVWRLVKDYVPYDHEFRDANREQKDKLFRLGDFVRSGVCNERGMLLQITLQYLGIRSQWRAGTWGGPDDYHAWVEAEPRGDRGQTRRLLVDPQNSRPLDFENPEDKELLDEYERSYSDYAHFDALLQTVQHDAHATAVFNDLRNAGLQWTEVADLQGNSPESQARIDAILARQRGGGAEVDTNALQRYIGRYRAIIAKHKAGFNPSDNSEE